MIHSPVLRSVLVLVLLGFAWFSFSLLGEPGGSKLVAVGMGLVSLTAAGGFAWPGKRRVALRIVAAAIVCSYVTYFVAELIPLLHGQRQTFAPGQPSALMAGVGMLVWGVALFIYSLSGQSPRERAYAVARARDKSGVLADRETLQALARAGADVEQPTSVVFSLTFPSRDHTASALNVLEREGWAATIVSPSTVEEQWQVSVTHEMVPSWENIRAVRARFVDLTQTLGGEVAGWEAKVRRAADAAI